MIDTSLLTTDPYLYNYRINREPYVARVVGASEGSARAGIIAKALTADEVNAELDYADKCRLEGIGGTIDPENSFHIDPGTHATLGKFTAAEVSELAEFLIAGRPSRHAVPGDGSFATFNALNVDFVAKNAKQGPVRGLQDYARFISHEAAKLKIENETVIFTGAYGKDRVTHDVDEYIGWLNEAALKRAGAMLKVATQVAASV